MVQLTEQPCFCVAIEHFAGHTTDIVAVFLDLEEAKAFQKAYDSLNRVSIVIYRTSLFAPKKTRKVKNA